MLCIGSFAMKTKSSIALVVFCIAALGADAFVPGEVSTVTLALTGSQTQEVTNTSTLYQTASHVTKYGNAQFLQDLFDEGLLTGAVSIVGWKLVVVNTTPLYTDNNPTFVFYAVNGSSKVKIDPSRFAFIAGAGANADTNKVTYDGSMNVLSDVGSFTSVVSLTGTASTGGGTSTMNLQGVATGTQKRAVVTVASATGGASQTNTYELIGAVKVTAISGDLEYSDPDKNSVVVQGSISFSAFVPTDISNYP